MALLVVFAGLPGVGKTTLARAVARELGAVYLRIDTVEEALRSAGSTVDEAGYAVAVALAADNLGLGLGVVADGVNPVVATREAWRATATGDLVEIEVVCSDPLEHRRRVEGRGSPTWEAVTSRVYDPWDRPRVVIDTAGRSVEDGVVEILERLGRR